MAAAAAESAPTKQAVPAPAPAEPSSAERVAAEPSAPPTGAGGESPAVESAPAPVAMAAAAPVASALAAPAGRAKQPRFAASRAAVRDNVAADGRKIVCAQVAALLVTTALLVASFVAWQATENSCDEEPTVMGLKEWYLSFFLFEVVSVGFFIWLIISLLCVWRAPVTPEEREGAPPHDWCTCSVMGSTFALVILTALVVFWSIPGLWAARTEAECGSGSGYFWCIYAAMWVSVCFCTGGSVAETYRRRWRQQATRDLSPLECYLCSYWCYYSTFWALLCCAAAADDVDDRRAPASAEAAVPACDDEVAVFEV